LLAVILFLICFMNLKKSSQKSSKLYLWKKYGIIIIAIVSIGVFFIGINFLAYTYNQRWDVTKAKQHTLTGSTIILVKALKKEVQLTTFYVGMPPKYLEDLFEEYERLSEGKIKTEIIDPIVQIGYAAKFGNVISGKEKKVIVQSGVERMDIDFTKTPLSEEQLTNAILRMTREARNVYILTGHREYSIHDKGDNGLSTLSKLLSANNISSKELMLGIEKEIPEDCDVLIIAGPHDSLTEKEKATIEEYLERGGDALFLIEQIIVTTPDNPLTEEEKDKNPSLNSILNKWGINIGNDIVVDLSSHASGDAGSPATRNYMPHKAITENLDYTFYVRPRSISVLENRRKSIKIAPIVFTASKEKSWAETNRTLQIEFDETVDTPGPVPIAFVILDPKSQTSQGRSSPDSNDSIKLPASRVHLTQNVGKEKMSDTRIIVFTDADFLTNVFINKYSNAEMGLNIINWLSELDYRVFLDQREIKVDRFDLTSKQKRIIVIILFLMPVLVAITGIMTWFWQRN
jgi:ABC-type uncharacterized transport system involved in gliding motility auxiliary subunit